MRISHRKFLSITFQYLIVNYLLLCLWNWLWTIDFEKSDWFVKSNLIFFRFLILSVGGFLFAMFCVIATWYSETKEK